MEINKVNKVKKLPKKINVCAYARVSTEKDAMLDSLANQVSYYSSYIQSRRDWLYVGVFSDEAISGTKANRPGFQKMLEGHLPSEALIQLSRLFYTQNE